MVILHKDSWFLHFFCNIDHYHLYCPPTPSPHFRILVKHYGETLLYRTVLNILKAPDCLYSLRIYSLEEEEGKSLYFGTSKELQELQAKERLTEGHGLFLPGWDILAIFVGLHSNPVVPTRCSENQGPSTETKKNKDNIMNSSLNFCD